MKHRHIHARHDEYVHIHRAAPASASSDSSDWSMVIVRYALGLLFCLILLSLIPGWFWFLLILGAFCPRSK